MRIKGHRAWVLAIGLLAAGMGVVLTIDGVKADSAGDQTGAPATRPSGPNAMPAMVAFQKALGDGCVLKLSSHLVKAGDASASLRSNLPRRNGALIAGMDTLGQSDVILTPADGTSPKTLGTLIVVPNPADNRSSSTKIAAGKDALLAPGGCWLVYVAGSQLNIAFFGDSGMLGVRGIARSVRSDTLGDAKLSVVSAANADLPANQVQLVVNWQGANTTTSGKSVTFTASYSDAGGIKLDKLDGDIPAAMAKLVFTPSVPNGLPQALATLPPMDSGVSTAPTTQGADTATSTSPSDSTQTN